MLKFAIVFAVIISKVYCQYSEESFTPDYSDDYGNDAYGTGVTNFGGEEYEEFPVIESENGFGYDPNYTGLSGSGDELTAAVGTYLIDVQMKFKSRLQDETSRRFEKLSQDVDRQLKAYLGEDLVLIEDDIQVQVLSFEPVGEKRFTRATVSVEINAFAGKTNEELTESMLRFSNRGRISRKKVTGVTEVAIPEGTEIPDEMGPEGTESPPADYEVIIAYGKRFKKVLKQNTSSAFQSAKSAVEEEVRLFLTASGGIPPSNLVSVDVVGFEPRPRRSTAAVMTITLTDTSPERLDVALQGLIGGTLYESPIISADLIRPEEILPEEPTPFEPTPPEPTPSEPTPSEPTPSEPTPPEPTPPEPTPPEPTPSVGTSNRGDEEPDELPNHCQLLDSPEEGSVACSNTNEISSTCTFSCSSGFMLRGPTMITCKKNGLWNGEIPYCKIKTCNEDLRDQNSPHTIVDCSNDDLLGSICTYRCDRGYQVEGDTTRECQENGEWSGSEPTCEIIPVDCEIAFRPWTECEDNRRYQEGYIVQEAVGTGNPCPSPVPYNEEECADCRIAWGEWGECADGYRRRFEVVRVEPIGAGEPCPQLQTEREECVDCVLEWGGWSECSNGERQRTEVIAAEPIGAGSACPSRLQTETEVCTDCVVDWGEWGKCVNDTKIRSQEIRQSPQGAGDPCPDLRTQRDFCINCLVAWSDWNECANGARTRSQVVLIQPYNGGDECPSLQEESEDCVDCVIAWGEWSECSELKRTRTQYVVSPPVGNGQACPRLATQEELCIDCEVGWGNWSECLNGERRKSQYVVTPSSGAGDTCPPLKDLVEVCIDCVMGWGPWSECDGFERYRDPVVETSPQGEGAKECPHVDKETEECFNCQLAWDDWSDCENGEQTRSQIILIEPEGGGKECEFLPSQTKACADCELSWEPWGECENGIKTRREYVRVQKLGSGLNCPRLDVQTSDCSDCIVDWNTWSECQNGVRSREQYIVSEAEDGGRECPEVMRVESEICIDCELDWADWSRCFNGSRVRYQFISVLPEGAGKRCPNIQKMDEVCVHCVVEWGGWGDCESGRRSRTQFIAVNPVGAGDPCGELRTENEVCIDCVLDWTEYGECLNGLSKRTEYVVTPADGAGAPCPPPRAQTQVCADCVIEWGDWSDCDNGRRSRTQEVVIEQFGNGKECADLKTEAETCGVPKDEDVLCRYTREFLGYGGNRNRRDILLLGDESGSIGWINYEKIKTHFKAVAHQIRGGVDSDHAQIAMMSFAGWSRILFGFDAYGNADDVVAAISKAKYHGGHRSKIGRALIEANTWMFQQSEGMRGFPGYDDDITHEILIATDGCRTSSGYYLLKGLRKIQKRGVKLSVLGIQSNDPRCREALREMRTDEIDLYEVGNWEDLDRFTIKIERRVCQP